MNKFLTQNIKWASFAFLLLMGASSCSKDETDVPGKQAYDIVADGNMYFAITSDSTVDLTRGGSDFQYSGQITVPSTILSNGKNYTVTGIGEKAFENCSQLTSVTLPETLKQIGNMAFYGCSAIKNINLPENTLNFIGYSAFQNCSSLESISIPENVTSIGASTFSGCTGLRSVAFPDGLKEIGFLAFKDCSGLDSITLDDGLTTVASSAFDSCKNIKKVHFYATEMTTTERFLPGSVEEVDFLKPGETSTEVRIIPDYAFQGCNLRKLDIPKGFLRVIGAHAFEDCKQLTSFSFPYSGLYCLRDHAFAGCEKLETLEYTDKSGYGTGVLPSTLKEFTDSYGGVEYTDEPLGAGVFENCKSLEQINLSNSKKVYTLTEDLFSGCANLQKVTVNKAITSVDKNCFSSCTKLDSLLLPESVTELGEQAFINCFSLSFVQVGTSSGSDLAYVGNKCFYGCAGLTDLALWTTQVPETGSDLFPADVNKNGHTLYVRQTLIGTGSDLNSFRGRKEWNNWYGMDAIDK